MIKKILLAGVLLLSLFPGYVGAAAPDLNPPEDEATELGAYVSDQLLIRFRSPEAGKRVDKLLARHGMSRLRHIETLDVYVLRLPRGLPIERAIEILSHLPEVEFVEPNYVMRALASGKIERAQGTEVQWGVEKIQAPEAWDEINPKEPVLLAVVDTGIDRYHPDVAANIWQKPEEDEIPDNGIDDDNNGYIDDVWGWDFRNGDNDPFDDNMHGTAVSGTAVGVQDGAGVVGVCPWCEVMSVKVLGGDGSGNLDTVADGIIYAADSGARVINLSLGAPIGSSTLEDAVNYAWNQGAVVVSATGNDAADGILYPAALDNAMAVASTNDQDLHSCFSNYEEGKVSVSAPGQNILCATPNGEYGTYSGTSLAAPHVSGLALLLFSQDDSRTNAQVKALIESTAEDLGPVGADAYFGAGRINALRAVTGVTTPTNPPPAEGITVTDITASGYAHARKLARDASGNLHWVWHSRDGDQYQVLYITSSDDGASWSQPEVVFQSSAETYHPALAVDESNVLVVFPSRDGASNYQVFFASKPLAGGSWSAPVAVMGGAYHAVRPDLYVDPSNGRLHLAASSFDDAPYVYYANAEWDTGAGDYVWNTVQQVDVGNYDTRYADVHAYGSNVYIVGRSVESLFLGLFTQYRVFSIWSSNDGASWEDLTQLALDSADSGISLAGVGDRLYLSYGQGGVIQFRQWDIETGWSAAESIATGAWPSLSQNDYGQAWLMWERDGDLILRHAATVSPTLDWGPEETWGQGYYPNLKLGSIGDRVEWATTSCPGAPFQLMYNWRDASGPPPPTPTPTPTSTPTPTDTPTPTGTPTGTPTPTPTPGSAILYFSLAYNGTVDGLSVDNEDIVAFDGAQFSTYLDGSDVGLEGFTIDAFAIVIPDQVFLMSFAESGSVPGIGDTVQDCDIVQFTASSLGEATAGSFSLYFDGSDVGLSSSLEDVDAIELLPDGRLLVSTNNNFGVPGLFGYDEDVIAFSPSSLGSETAGTWAMYFDGDNIGLDSPTEDIDGVAVDSLGDIYGSTVGAFSLDTLSGEDRDVFACHGPTLGEGTTSCASLSLFFDGSQYDLGINDLFSIELP
jgi:thermitase